MEAISNSLALISFLPFSPFVIVCKYYVHKSTLVKWAIPLSTSIQMISFLTLEKPEVTRTKKCQPVQTEKAREWHKQTEKGKRALSACLRPKTAVRESRQFWTVQSTIVDVPSPLLSCRFGGGKITHYRYLDVWLVEQSYLECLWTSIFTTSFPGRSSYFIKFTVSHRQMGVKSEIRRQTMWLVRELESLLMIYLHSHAVIFFSFILIMSSFLKFYAVQRSKGSRIIMNVKGNCFDNDDDDHLSAKLTKVWF